MTQTLAPPKIKVNGKLLNARLVNTEPYFDAPTVTVSAVFYVKPLNKQKEQRLLSLAHTFVQGVNALLDMAIDNEWNDSEVYHLGLPFVKSLGLPSGIYDTLFTHTKALLKQRRTFLKKLQRELQRKTAQAEEKRKENAFLRRIREKYPNAPAKKVVSFEERASQHVRVTKPLLGFRWRMAQKEGDNLILRFPHGQPPLVLPLFVPNESPMRDMWEMCQGDLRIIRRKNRWVVNIPCKRPVRALKGEWNPDLPPTFIGVDVNVNHLATVRTPQGTFTWDGKPLRQIRLHEFLLRKRYQKHRRLCDVKRRAGHEANVRDWIDHNAALWILSIAQRYPNPVLVIEDLSRPADNRKRKDPNHQRMTHSWSFFDLQQKLLYKATERKIPVLEVNAAYTSRECPRCGTVNMKNLVYNSPQSWTFHCVHCGYKDDMDQVAALNLVSRAKIVWAHLQESSRQTD